MQRKSISLLFLITFASSLKPTEIGLNWTTCGALTSPLIVLESLFIWRQYRDKRDALEQATGLKPILDKYEKEALEDEKRRNQEDSRRIWTVHVVRPVVYEAFLGKDTVLCNELKSYLTKEHISMTVAFFSGFLGILSAMHLTQKR